MKNILIAGAALAALSFGGAATAATFPAIGEDASGPGLVITVALGGATSIAVNPNCGVNYCGPYDGSDDTYIGVINNSASTVSSLNLSAPSSAGVFGFEGDGIAGYTGSGGGNAQDSTGYGGPNAYFTNIVFGSNVDTGTVNFITAIAANGGSSYFSLEEALTVATFTGGGGGITAGGGVPEPTSWAMMIVGFFGLGSVLRQQRRSVTA